MKHYLVQAGDSGHQGGKIYCELVSSLPPWDPSYEGCLVLNTAEMNLYYGTATGWKKTGGASGSVTDGRLAVFNGVDGTIRMGSSNAYIDGSGYLYASRVYNAVWNDIADYIDVDPETVIEFGKCYVVNSNQKVVMSNLYCEEGILGITTDTYGFGLGLRGDSPVNKVPICIGGFVLAHVDKIYPPGTPLTSAINGFLTKIADDAKASFPERVVGIFFKQEHNTEWNGVPVNGRHWVKVI